MQGDNLLHQWLISLQYTHKMHSELNFPSNQSINKRKSDKGHYSLAANTGDCSFSLRLIFVDFRMWTFG